MSIALRVIVVGGGIKGSALAAMLSANARHDVLLLEKDVPAVGATSTNHGRLHLGTSSWRTDSDELTERRMMGSELMRMIPDVLDQDSDARYIFHDSDLADRFSEFCVSRLVPHREFDSDDLNNAWMSNKGVCRSFEVPEYGFNPASVCSRFVKQHVLQGGSCQFGKSVKKIQPRTGCLEVLFEDDSRIQADIVVNATSRWSDSIGPQFPDFEVECFEWRILCCKAKHLPALTSIVVGVDKLYESTSAIPHQNWITFDCKTPLLRRASPDSPANCNWGIADSSKHQDRLMLEAAATWFKPIAGAHAESRVYSFAGIHGRLKNAEAGSESKVVEHPELENYWLTFGGQASTAVLDAYDVAIRILGTDADVSMLSALVRVGCEDVASMIWERAKLPVHRSGQEAKIPDGTSNKTLDL